MAAIWGKRICWRFRASRTVSALFLAFAGFHLAAALAQGVQARLEASTSRAFLTGQLLVASPNIEDPRFQHTVILIVRHDKDGAFGITINRPAGEVPLADLLKALGEKDAAAQGTVKILAGGPVQPGAGFVIHTPEYSRSGTVVLNGFVAMTASKEVFRDMGQSKGPRKVLVAFGYAGWGENQLEAEMARKDWYIAAADSELVFDEKRDRLWDVAMERPAARSVAAKPAGAHGRLELAPNERDDLHALEQNAFDFPDCLGLRLRRRAGDWRGSLSRQTAGAPFCDGLRWAYIGAGVPGAGPGRKNLQFVGAGLCVRCGPDRVGSLPVCGRDEFRCRAERQGGQVRGQDGQKGCHQAKLPVAGKLPIAPAHRKALAA